MIVVHHLADSHSQRILWLLEELDVPYDIKRYQRDPVTGLAPAEFKAIHPIGMSSVITDNGKVAAGSGAIINYILREYAGGRLQPDTAEGAFDDYAYWMHAADASAMPALVIRLNVAQVDPNASVLTRLDAEITNYLEYMEEKLEGRDYLLGGGLTVADIQISAFGELANALIGVAKFPNVAAWINRFRVRPAYQRGLIYGESGDPA